MTKAELIERIARSRSLPPDITKKDIDRIVTVAFDEIANYFARAKVTSTSSPKFSFPRFGTFVKKRRSARRGVNPRTLEPMNIDAFFTLDFRTSGELRDAMNLAKPESDAPTSRRGAKASGPRVQSAARAIEVAAAPIDAELDARLPAPGLQRVRGAAAGGRVRSA